MVLGIFIVPDTTLILGEPVKPAFGLALGFFLINLEAVDIGLQDLLVGEGTDPGIVGFQSRIHAALTVVLFDDLEGAISQPVLAHASYWGRLGLDQITEEWGVCFRVKIKPSNTWFDVALPLLETDLTSEIRTQMSMVALNRTFQHSDCFLGGS